MPAKYVLTWENCRMALGRDGSRQVIHPGLFKVWRLDLVVRSSLPAVSGGGLG